MPRLPKDLPGLRVIKALSKLGFRAIRQKGSHVVLEKLENNERWGCVVPMHKELKKGLEQKLLKRLGKTEK